MAPFVCFIRKGPRSSIKVEISFSVNKQEWCVQAENVGNIAISVSLLSRSIYTIVKRYFYSSVRQRYLFCYIYKFCARETYCLCVCRGCPVVAIRNQWWWIKRIRIYLIKRCINGVSFALQIHGQSYCEARYCYLSGHYVQNTNKKAYIYT